MQCGVVSSRVEPEVEVKRTSEGSLVLESERLETLR